MAHRSKDEIGPPGNPHPLTRISRFETWEQDLAEFLETAANRPFAWGAHDCCLFVSEAIRIMTGTDIAEIEHLRGNYHDERGAYRVLSRAVFGKGRQIRVGHFREAMERLAEEFGFPPWSHPALAQRGDVALVEDILGRIAPGIVDLTGRWVACLGPEGLLRLPLDRILIAWKI